MHTEIHDNTNQILTLHQRWLEAELRGDVAALEPILDEEFLAVGPLGFMLTKEQWLARHQSGDLKYQELMGEDATVRQYGDAAIVVLAQTQRATYKGNEVPGGRFRVTLIVIRREGRLVIAGLHLSPIAQPPGR